MAEQKRLRTLLIRCEGRTTSSISKGKFASAGALTASLLRLSFLFSSSMTLQTRTLFHTSLLHFILNELGTAITNDSISPSLVRLSTSHRIARSSQPLRSFVSPISIASCISEARCREYTVPEPVFLHHRLYHDIIPLADMRTPKTSRKVLATVDTCGYLASQAIEHRSPIDGDESTKARIMPQLPCEDGDIQRGCHHVERGGSRGQGKALWQAGLYEGGCSAELSEE